MFDTHTHLNSSELYSRRNEVIKDAIDAGVNYFLCVGFDYETNKTSLLIAKEYDNVYATVGYHPSEATKIRDNDFILLEEYIKNNPKIKAIGECGLDYYWTKDDIKLQKKIFREQIKLAYKYDLPLVIHMRDATEDTLSILKEEYKTPYKGIMHCYSGSLESMREFVRLGFHIAIGGVVTFKNAKTIKEVVPEIPNDRLLVETDSPFLTPHPYRGQVNEPKYVKLVCEEIAKLKNVSVEEIDSLTTNNAKRLLNIN